MSFKPYYINFYDAQIKNTIGRVKIDKDVNVVDHNANKLPKYLAFNQFVADERSGDAVSCGIKIIDLHTNKSITVDNLDLSNKAEKDTSNYYFSYSLEWASSSELTYVTSRVIDGAFVRILVWKYVLGKKKSEIAYSFIVDNAWRKSNNVWTDKYKVHAYGGDFLVVDDHQVTLKPSNDSCRELYRCVTPKSMIVDALLVR